MNEMKIKEGSVKKHTSIIREIECLGNVVCDLERLSERVNGRDRDKDADINMKDAEKAEDEPNLSKFLTETPERLEDLSVRIRKVISELNESLF